MSPSLAEIGEALYRAPPPAEALANALLEVRNGNGEAIFKALLQRSQRDAPAQFRNLMTALERIAELDDELGLYLMGRLYPLAGKRDHDIYNAIELWAHAASSHEAVRGLERVAQESRPMFQKRIAAWARHIASKLNSK